MARIFILLGIACLIIAIFVALSGYQFVSKFDISTDSLSIAEGAILQISLLKYLIGAIFVLVASIFFSSSSLISAIKNNSSIE